jgi:hypothetical protein
MIGGGEIDGDLRHALPSRASGTWRGSMWVRALVLPDERIYQ